MTEGVNTPKQSAEQLLGTVGIAVREAGSAESMRANRAWWNADADDYHDEHGELLGTHDFVWCPEGLTEDEARLLGDITGKAVLEVGCGSAQCSRWLAAHGARPVALDLSEAMLGYARAFACPSTRLVQAEAERLPFTGGCFDIACSAFGAIPFVPDIGAVFCEVARVLRPGGRWVFSVSHPMRWPFPDLAGDAGLTINQSYFNRTPYVEVDAEGNATYVEHHHTMSDYVNALHGAGFVLQRLIEPEWPAGRTMTWGQQWSPERGALFPGTAIFCAART